MIAGEGQVRSHSMTGLANWIAWSAATLFVLYQLATQNSIGAMQNALSAEMSLSAVEIGVISASFLFIYALMQIPAGMLLDRWRPRLLLPPAALGVALSAWLMSMATGFWGLVAARALMGMCAAFAFPGAGLMARRRLPASQFALAMGLIDFAFGVGAYLGDAGVGALLAVQTWQGIMIDFAFFGALVAILCWACIGRTTPQGEVATHSALGQSMIESLRAVWSVRQVRLATITASALMSTMFAFGGLWDVPLQKAFGYTQEDAIGINSWLFVGIAVMPPIAGWCADRWHARREILLGGQVVSVITMIVILAVDDPWPYWLVGGTLLILGLGIGTCVLTFPIACDAVSPANTGAAIGVVNAAGLLTSAIFQVIPGIALAVLGSHSLTIMRVVLALFVVIAMAGLWATWRMEPRCKAAA